MKMSPEIWNELMGISPLVAGILRPDDLYRLPEGYFDKLADDLLSLVQAEQTQIHPSFLGQLDKNPLFPIPGNYFEDFPGKMLSLVQVNRPVSVQEELGAFSPLLGQIGKNPPFSVPDGYFEELSGGLAASSFAREESAVDSPLMANLKEIDLYEVPQGYFNELPQLILNKVKQGSGQAKVVSLGKSRIFFKYAAAAIVAGALLIGGSFFFNHSNKAVADAANPVLATVSDQEILNYMESLNVPLSDMNSLAAVDVTENDGNDLLSDVSDEELQQYLNEHVSPKELKDN